MEINVDIQQILKCLPHRYPFLLVDRVLELEKNKSIKALKNVTMNEPFFAGHFPELPIMPGVLILEALAQASGILAMNTFEHPEKHKSLLYFAGIDGARFRRIVKPGDQLILSVEVIQMKRDIWKFKSDATVEGELVCSAQLLAARRDMESD
jgi:3-hydroxyacyl-[acyl-carrier-protein] dehydratase